MTKQKIIPVILAGGTGSRLWPVSREDVPKQFCNLGEAETLFQQSVRRVMDEEVFEPPIIITSDRHSDLVQRQLHAVQCVPNAIVCEPMGRDTAAAVLLAAELSGMPDDALLLVMPSDHKMENEAAFVRAVQGATPNAAHDRLIVTFGITPTHPETGYGYVRAGSPLFNSAVSSVEKFIEKPDEDRAAKLLNDPMVFWNAGIFLFDRKTVRREFEIHAPLVAATVRNSVKRGQWSARFFHPEGKAFRDIPRISFDHAVMEKTSRAAIIPMFPDWYDMGSWKAIWELSQHDDNHNVVGENCFIENAEDCLVRSEGPVVGVSGLKDIVVVACKDAVLVTSRSNPNGVKHLVKTMKAESIKPAIAHLGEDRPWGRFDSLDVGSDHQVKRIRVDPGERLSLQYHHHRSEHWIVVTGVATVTVDSDVRDLSLGEVIYVPQGATHRLENKTNTPVEIIEVQIGGYLGEDDIVRVEDIYGRPPVPHSTFSDAA